MRPPENEPDDQELEELVDNEDRVLHRPDVPDDVKADITQRRDLFRDEEYADEIEDGPPPA
jgi:hypothetical protein